MTSRLEFRNESGEGFAVENVTFTEWLSALKASGSNLLITGEVPAETSAVFSRTLFGKESRTRILGLVDPTALDAAAYLPVPPNGPRTQVVDRRLTHRAAAGSTANRPIIDRESFRSELISAITVHGDRNDGFAPAELRLGLDSVDALEIDDDSVSVGQFLRGITALVRGVYGMAHYHLRVPDDDPMVDGLSPLFDARIELRNRPERAEHRWHVPALDETTNWVELS